MPPKKRTSKVQPAAAAAAAANVFDGLVFALLGKFSCSQGDMKSKIEDNGGVVVSSVTAKVTHVVSLPEFLAAGSAKFKSAHSKGLPIVTEQWIEDCVEGGILSTSTAASHRLDAAVSGTAKVNGNGTNGSNGSKKRKKAAKDDDAKDDAKPAPKRRGKAAAKNDDDAKAPATKTTGKRKGRAVATATTADDAAADDDKPAKKSRGKKKANDQNGATTTAAAAPAPALAPAPAPVKQVTVTVKGRAPVDELFVGAANFHVYEKGNDVYDVMLNQTEIANNNNKYYIIQLVQSDAGNTYYCWTRWGRVGAIAGSAKLGSGDFNSALSQFHDKFRDKTGNTWDNRHNFVKKAGKYQLLERDYSADDPKVDEKKNGVKKDNKPKEIPPSTLPPAVQRFIELVADVKMMRQAVMEIGYDAEKLPLGKLSKRTIEQGYKVLQDIANVLDGKNRADLTQLSSAFYTLIPHVTQGMRPPPIIRNKEQLKEKMLLCESLADIEIAMKLLSQSSEDINENPVDTHYKNLHCTLEPVDPDSDEMDIIQQYVQNTHAATHNTYSLEVQDVFRVDKEGEKEKFKPFSKDPNRMLLWHGSRLTNWVGILSQGLRIAPPEAPVTGYMFGKGVYFADMVSKSANYCFTNAQNNTGVLLLAEVALGKPNVLYHSDYDAARLPAGTLSTKGAGTTEPDPSATITLDDGVKVPLGTGVNAKIPAGASLLYNEYIVYNTAQIRIRYVVSTKFKY